MKAYLIAGVCGLVLAGGLAYAGNLTLEKRPPNPNIVMRNAPDCPTGFFKTNVVNGATHGFTCMTQPIRCPSKASEHANNGGMIQPQARTMGAGDQASVQFSYKCEYTQIN